MNKEKVGFCPERERKYLAELPISRREKLEVLKQEVKTAVAESFLTVFTNEYEWWDGKIIDLKSGESLSLMTERGGRPEENKALGLIEKELAEGKDLVVHFSPKNKTYDYPNNYADIWRLDEGKVLWVRVECNKDFEEMIDIYKELGGEEEIRNEFDLLSKSGRG